MENFRNANAEPGGASFSLQRRLQPASVCFGPFRRAPALISFTVPAYLIKAAPNLRADRARMEHQ